MKESGVFELGDQVKLVGLGNPYVGRKGIFIEYRRVDFREPRLVVLVEGDDEFPGDRKHSFSQGEVELDK
ncbi:hypothetical protein ES705_33600 [subsurface metagenome]